MKSVAGDTTASSVSLCALGAIIGRYVRFKNLELLLYLLDQCRQSKSDR